jgi:hypothetical protein
MYKLKLVDDTNREEFLSYFFSKFGSDKQSTFIAPDFDLEAQYYFLLRDNMPIGFSALEYAKNKYVFFWISLEKKYQKNIIAYRFCEMMFKRCRDFSYIVSEVKISNSYSVALHFNIISKFGGEVKHAKNNKFLYFLMSKENLNKMMQRGKS